MAGVANLIIHLIAAADVALRAARLPPIVGVVPLLSLQKVLEP